MPDAEEIIQKHLLGAVGMDRHEKFSGPYETKEEAIKAAKDSGCTNMDVAEWDEFC